MITIALILVIGSAVGIIVFIVVRKFPQLSIMNAEDTVEKKMKKLKQQIVLQRMSRWVNEKKAKVITQENWQRVKYIAGQSYRKIKVLEEKYKVHTKDAKTQLLLKRGRDSIVDDPEIAEQCFLDVITMDSHNLEAYEALSQIYLKKKDFSEAIELLEFLMKLNPASAGRYLFDISVALMQAGDFKGAWQYASQAITFEPTNPKFLDFLTELAILRGVKRDGMRFLKKLEEVNPENGKLEEFRRRLDELSKEEGE